jgi:hypothetical protein
MEPLTVRGAVVRTAHVLLGSGILATAVVVALHASARRECVRAVMPSPDRLSADATSVVTASAARLEGAV